MYLAAIAAARRSIYIEGQYFAARCIGEAIAERLREADGPEIVVINSKRARGWVEEKAMGAARRRLLGYFRSADHHGRFRIYSPVTAAGAPIYVHAKVLVVDDRILRIGSANLNNRSMGFDTECDLVIDALGDEAMAETISRAVVAFRNELLAEHLRVSPEDVVAALLREKGSLIKSIEALRSGSDPKLVPLDIPDANPTPLSEGELLDPEQPEPLAAMLVHAIRDSFVRPRR